VEDCRVRGLYGSSACWATGIDSFHSPNFHLYPAFLYSSVHIFLDMPGAARFYPILKSFLSLRSLPSGAYMTVQWSNAIPHV
jgi:hypothetical protein